MTMSASETVKQNFENLTGYGKPTDGDAKGTLRMVEPQQFLFAADGKVPNNPGLPFLVYKNAVALDPRFDPAAVFEQLFAANGWGSSWRNGIFPYVHYHASIHEVLGIARGSARVRFGGTEGVEIEVAAGDVAVLPAGTGHQPLAMSDDLLVVGAYPPQGEYDERRGRADEYARARVAIARTPLPACDPLYGPDGPLTKLWRP
jgi:uncharacterized protein YjlB